MTVLVIDAQGGGLGKQLVTKIKSELPEVRILAVGTNSIAAAAMLKAGAHEAATEENAVMVASRKADVIIGPIGMLIADAMLGEITPAMALAVAQADAKKIIIPFSNCDNYVAGGGDMSISRLVEDAVEHLKIV